jgi:hypothetical protein
LSPSESARDAGVPRHLVVARILRTADELERLARSGDRAAESDLELVIRGGSVRVQDRCRVVLGRGRGCDVVLRGNGVSRVHAALVRCGSRWWIEDLGSRNGTWVGGERVARRRVCDGDVLHLGGEPVRCRIG